MGELRGLPGFWPRRSLRSAENCSSQQSTGEREAGRAVSQEGRLRRAAGPGHPPARGAPPSPSLKK